MNMEDKNSIFELTLEDTSTRCVKNLNQASFFPLVYSYLCRSKSIIQYK